MKIWKILSLSAFLTGIISVAIIQTQTISQPKHPVLKPKVATTNLSADEIVYALLSEQGELERWVGHSELATSPDYSHLSKDDIYANSPNIAMVHSVESIIATKPDLVIVASFNRKELIEQVKALGIRILLLDRFQSFEDIKANIEIIGEAIGANQEAKKLVDSLDMRVARLTSKPLSLDNGQSPSFILFSESSVVMGKKTSLDAMVSLIGGKLVPAELGITGWGQLNDEALANSKPNFIISTLELADDKSKVAYMKSFGAWRLVESLKTHNILSIPHKDLLSVSHYFVSGLESLHAKAEKALKMPKVSLQQPQIKTKGN